MRDARVRAILRGSQPPLRQFWPAVAFGVLSAGSAVALLAVSAWLITRASEQPSLIYISVAVVGVRAFALGRAAFRYLERLVGHDAAFRQLASSAPEWWTRSCRSRPTGSAPRDAGTFSPRWRTTSTRSRNPLPPRGPAPGHSRDRVDRHRRRRRDPAACRRAHPRDRTCSRRTRRHPRERFRGIEGGTADRSAPGRAQRSCARSHRKPPGTHCVRSAR